MNIRFVALLLSLAALLGCSSGPSPAPDAGPAAVVPAPSAPRRGAVLERPSGGVYQADAGTYADGTMVPLHVDSLGRLITTTEFSGVVDGGRVQVAETNSAAILADLATLIGAAPSAAAATTLLVSTQLPASGAYQAAPTAADAGVPIATGSVALPTRACEVWLSSVLGDGGTSSSQAACKFYHYSPTDDGGFVWGQIATPVDQSFAGYSLQAGAGVVAIPITLPATADRVGLACAEIGTTSSPVVLSAWVRCR